MNIDKLLNELKNKTTDQNIKNIIDALGGLDATNEDILKNFEENGLISFNPRLRVYRKINFTIRESYLI